MTLDQVIVDLTGMRNHVLTFASSFGQDRPKAEIIRRICVNSEGKRESGNESIGMEHR